MIRDYYFSFLKNFQDKNLFLVHDALLKQKKTNIGIWMCSSWTPKKKLKQRKKNKNYVLCIKSKKKGLYTFKNAYRSYRQLEVKHRIDCFQFRINYFRRKNCNRWCLNIYYDSFFLLCLLPIFRWFYYKDFRRMFKNGSCTKFLSIV